MKPIFYNNQDSIESWEHSFKEINLRIAYKTIEIYNSRRRNYEAINGFGNSKDVCYGDIEEYRKFLKKDDFEKAQEIIDTKENEILELISEIENVDFQFEHLFVLTPTTDNSLFRNRIIEKFKDQLINDIEIIDLSNRFTKQDTSLSIKENAKFSFESDGLSKLNSILIIDDTIDSGQSVGQLIDALILNDLIDNSTIISLQVLYQNFKPNPKM